MIPEYSHRLRRQALSTDKSYSLSIAGDNLLGFIVKTLICVALFFYICGFINKANPLTSLVQSSLLGGLIVALYTQLLIKESKWSVCMLCIYFIKCLIGVFHYTSFIDPGYFQHPTNVMLTDESDFISMFEQVRIIAVNCWEGHKSLEDVAFMPHPELYWIIAGIFSKIGIYILSIIPVNAVSSMLAAIMIGYITKLRRGNYQVALVLAALFPLSLITSYFFRDMVGLCLGTFMVTCLLLAKRNTWVWLIATSVVLYLQRTIYCVIPILAYFIWNILKNRNQQNNKNTYYLVFIFAVLGFASLFSSLLLEGHESYTTSLDNPLLYILFPIRYLMCIIGPFPWTNTFMSPEKSFYLQDYIMSAAMFYVTLRFFPALYKDLKLRKPIDYLVILSILFMVTGIFNTHTHMTYICFGFIYLIPYISTKIFRTNDFLIFHGKYLVLMLLFNVIYIALGISGTSNMFK